MNDIVKCTKRTIFNNDTTSVVSIACTTTHFVNDVNTDLPLSPFLLLFYCTILSTFFSIVMLLFT